jgi:hypothetical protein
MRSKLIALATISLIALIGFYSPFSQDWLSEKRATDAIIKIDKKIDYLSLKKISQVESAADFEKEKAIHIEQINLLHQMLTIEVNQSELWSTPDIR